MEASASKTRSETPKRLIVKDPFLGKNRLRKEFVSIEEGAPLSLDLDSKRWSKLPEEVLLQVFAQLPVKDILRMRSLNKTWRSIITSPHFQVAFEGASLVRIALMVHDKVDGTMFLTREDGQECFRPGIARCPEVIPRTNVVATVNGLVCIIEDEKKANANRDRDMLEIRVFVMNVVTGFCRALPHPSDTPAVPSFVRMDTVPEGGYTITFMYIVKGCMSWEVYNSVENRWSKHDEDNMVHWNDREVFTIMHCMSTSGSFYENVAAFFTKTKVVKFFDLYASHGDFCDGEYIAHSVHDVSGDLYRLCARGGRHGVWRTKLTSCETWELVCECPKLEGTWTSLRVMNDVVVLLFKLPYHCKPDAQLFGVLGLDVGTIVKVFHMPTKSWHNFPEKDYVVQNWGVSIIKDYAGPFLVEAKFDVLP